MYAAAATPKVGSLLGLNPYSAISDLRSSAAFFRAFLFRHRKNPIKNPAAMATMGIITAIAIFAPELSPSEEPDPDPEALNADGVEVALEEVMVKESVAVPGFTGDEYEVTTTTEGVGVVVAPAGVDDGVCVMVSVTATTLGLGVLVVAGATYVVESGIDVTDVMVLGGSVELVSGVEIGVEDDSVTVIVVEKDVVKLVEVVPIVVVMTESVTAVLVSVDIVR